MLGLLYGTSGLTYDFWCYDAAGYVWNGSAWVVWNDADFVSYRVTTTEIGSTGRFSGTIPAGTDNYELRLRADTLAGSFLRSFEDEPQDAIAASSTQSSSAASGDVWDQRRYDDFDLVVATSTAADSRIVCTWRRCHTSAEPVLEMDTDSGLLSVLDVETPAAGDGSVIRAAEQITLHVDADAFDHLALGRYTLAVKEITSGGATITRYEAELYLIRGVSREMAS